MAVVEADAWRWDQWRQLATTMAWKAANWTRGTKMPPLKAALRQLKPKGRSKPRRQTAEEQIAIMKMVGAGVKRR